MSFYYDEGTWEAEDDFPDKFNPNPGANLSGNNKLQFAAGYNDRYSELCQEEAE